MLWMIPHWITPNMVTWLRIFLIPVVVYLNVIEEYDWGIPVFLFAAFTDAVDGSLARTRNQITDFGKVFDPIADKLLIGSMLVILVVQHIHPMIGFAVLALEALLIILAIVWKVLGHVPEANRWGKMKMILQCIAVCVILLGLTFHSITLFAIASWIFGAAILFAIVSLFFHGI